VRERGSDRAREREGEGERGRSQKIPLPLCVLRASVVYAIRKIHQA